MKKSKQILVFGEVLFDCFESGDEALGGAPFNVAWHLNAFGDKPKLISRIGQDAYGRQIIAAMNEWQMATDLIQHDSDHPTGRVDIKLEDNEPHYTIVTDVAYDFIEPLVLELSTETILYHGSLALRSPKSKQAFEQLCETSDASLFIDVNLRSPWWTQTDIEAGLYRARWAKLNHDEVFILGFNQTDIKEAAKAIQRQFNLEQVIITRGELGALVYSEQGEFYQVLPPQVNHFIDTVGAGDAFTARYIHGFLNNEAVIDTIDAAQKFAIKVIGLRGATTTEKQFYL